jgi:ABC-type uncharacterized transport system auxiliary subunit
VIQVKRKDSGFGPGSLGIAALLALFVLAGCLPRTRTPEKVNEYIVNYESPGVMAEEGQPPLQSVRVNRFSTAAPYADLAIVVRSGPFSFSSSPLERWRVSPGEMLGELLARDMRDCGLFGAVFSEYDISEAEVNLDGLVEELSEHREEGARTAVLKVRLTLSETESESGDFKVVFQRAYTEIEPIDVGGAEGFVSAMSRAANRFSTNALADIREALKGL